MTTANTRGPRPIQRRTFLKAGAAACAFGLLGLTGCTEETTNAEIVAGTTGKKKQYGLVINVTKFNEAKVADAVIEACHSHHNVPDTGDSRTAVEWMMMKTFDEAFEEIDSEYMDETVKSYEYPVLCNHCEEPPCVRVCPTKATFKRDDGIVTMDFHRCIGCRFCMSACPFGARSLNFSDPRRYLDEVNPDYPTRSKGVVEKCMFCYERIDKGELPLCVEASKGSILFGDLTDAQSDVRKALAGAFSIRRRVELGTGPNIYYIFESGE